MCILFIAVNQHRDYPLIIAANRDEFHQRATAFGHWWGTQPPILAGKDLVAGGTWMGITETGRLAALTNIRDPERQNDEAVSRGKLVTDCLKNNHTTTEFMHILKATRTKYNGYNLLFGEWHDLHVYNNHINELVSLDEGVHGLSNAALNSPWPKTTKGMQALSDYCQRHASLHSEALFDILRDDVKASDHELPRTGVPYHWEKLLSSTFIVTPEYGTRTSTVLMINQQGKVTWEERYFNAEGTKIHSDHFSFTLV
ncbi:NRDE family protein [Alteromonas sediminis]|uniref:NRDE family protein n=1 Tax=Alteromonas sediminis TaxID=2259342 RepID=A0A3N5YP08_9ALTE|nr:NRDE family protein [Alteromonas sediminis]RPJ67491.1 NRDE family protein [Alteromonas sediminis]